MLKLLPILLVFLINSCYYSSSQYFLKYQDENSVQIPDEWKNEEIIILEDTILISATQKGDNNIVIENSISYYYVNNTSNEKLSVMSFYENSEVEQFPQFEVSALYKDGSNWKSDLYDFKQIPRSYNGEYLTDDIIHLIEIPDYSEGMIIRVAKKRNLVMPEFSSGKFLRKEFPILKKYLEFSHPSTDHWKYKLSNGENLAFDTLVSSESNIKKFIIKADSLEKTPDQNIPHPEEWFCGLHISIPKNGISSHNWKTIGDYYLSLVYRNQESNSSALTDFVSKSRIRKNSPSDLIISKAFNYIQNNIRYYANMEDEHSYIPRSIPEILSKGYGDCKEMSVLLQGMLHRLGVKSNLALVGTKGSIQYLEEIPTLSAFNHIIVYIKDNDGNITYYDPTVDYGKASNSYMSLIGQKTLLLESKNSRTGKVERAKGHQNSFYSKSEVIKDKKSDSWKLLGTVSLTGEAAYSIFPYMKQLDKEELPPFLRKFLNEYFDFNTTSAFIDSSSDEFCRIKFEADFQSNFIKLENGGFRLQAPSLFGGNYRYTTQDLEGPRKFRQMEQIDEWILPKGFNDLEFKSLKTKFASGDWSIESGIARRSYLVKDIILYPKEDDEEYNYFKQKKKFVKAIVWR